MVFLNPYLPFDTSSTLPPPRSNLLISDILSAPAEFVLYHLVSAAISKQVKVRRPHACMTSRTTLSASSTDRLG